MYFSDYFKVRPQVIEKYGAFNPPFTIWDTHRAFLYHPNPL